MTHLELENLASEYVEGQLEAARGAEVEEHLRGCAACRELVADVRRVMELCRSATDLEPAPWLVHKILLATIGEKKPTLKERLGGFFRPAVQPRFAYGVAMAVFSFAIIVNAAGINLRNLTVNDLDPRTWVNRANRTGHLLYARAEKFYYDLRVVYEIESRVRQLRGQPTQSGTRQEGEAPKPEAPAGGSTHRKQPGNPQLAFAREVLPARPHPVGTARSSSR